MGQTRLKGVTGGSPVGGLNTVAPLAQMDPNDCIALINMIPSAVGVKTRLGSIHWTQHVGSTFGHSVYTPPTAGTATCVISGVSFTATFNTNATQTVADLMLLIQANSTINALVRLVGGTTMDVIARQPGTAGNGITTTTNGANGASFSAASTAGGTTTDLEVRTIIGWQASDPLKDKLFVGAIDGIYDATTSNVGAIKVVTFASATGLAGYIHWSSFTTVADHYIVACDEVNGYYIYTESTGLWTKPTLGGGAGQVANIDPATFTSVTPWQNRLFFTVQKSSVAWFLDVGAITGAATAFPFGNNMRRGGELRCMANWTVDGGSGIEDNLAVFSSAGDISVYTGTDPTQIGKFTLVGSWVFAGLPVGRRFYIDSGGDVLILTAFGLLSLSKLLQGPSIADRSIYETKKIDNVISAQVVANGVFQNWALSLSPDESSVLINIPQSDGTIIQFAMNYQTRGWARLEGRDSHSLGVWENHLYFGDGLGNVWKADGGKDKVNFDTTGGQAINFFIFSAYNGFGAPALNKRVQMCRPSFLAGDQSLGFVTACRFDFDLGQLTGLPTVGVSGGSLWDIGQWDLALWGGDLVVSSQLQGVNGIGRMVAVLVRGITASPVILNNATLFYDEGGYL